MRKPLIVTLSIVCMLKGACWDGQYKGSKQCIMCCVCYVSLLALSIWRSKHAMHWMLCLLIQSILVFVAFTQHCTQSTNEVWKIYSTLLCIQWPLIPPRGKTCRALHLLGLAVQGGSLINFLRLVNYKGDCSQDAQPIPNP